MNNNDIATYSKTKEILDKYDIGAKKSFGQNFLIDNNITRNIVNHANVDENTSVIEIGPGIGSLSQELARKAKKLLCIEIDTRLEEVLNDTLSEFDNIKVIYDDFLKIDLDKLINEEFDGTDRIVVVANLPYYITTAILIKIFESKSSKRIDCICAMMQKEVGQRLSASKDTKDYNSLTILTQYYSTTKLVMKIPKTVFIPAPKVDSVVVLFKLREPEFKPDNESLFFEILRVLFKQRRKTILNNLNELFNDKEITSNILNKANLDSKLRAENLSLDDIIQLSNVINKEGYDGKESIR